MFFAIIFLSLAALASHLFPDWSWAVVLGASLGCVLTLRLLLLWTRPKESSAVKPDND